MLSRVALRRLPTGRRAYSSTLPQLPSDPESWKKAFLTQGTNIRDRVSVRNPETAAKLANAFVPDGEKDRVIVEAFPGPLLSYTVLVCGRSPKNRSWRPYAGTA
jgi:hypothetical protein